MLEGFVRFRVSAAAALAGLISAVALAGLISSVGSAVGATLTYDVAGTFETSGGSDYADLSGGSFSGTFSVPSGTFPLSSSTYETFSSFTLNIYNAADQLVQTLSGATPGADLAITNDYIGNYGGEQIFFDVNGTDYLQLNLPTSFNGSGSILSGGTNYSYAEIGSGNYASLATGTVSPLAATPLPSTWTMMVLGLCGLGLIAFRTTKQRSAGLARA
jgi:hypothetical protein